MLKRSIRSSSVLGLAALGIVYVYYSSQMLAAVDIISSAAGATRHDDDAITTTTRGANTNDCSTTSSSLAPLSCFDFLKMTRKGCFDDPNRGEMHLKQTLTTPSFWVSLHNSVTDRIRYNALMNQGRYYETELEDVWRRVLSTAPPKSHVIDVGGNIGYFSLLTASLGPFSVTAFEPAERNIMRFCESILLNKWMNSVEGGGTRLPSIDIHALGLSSQDGVLVFHENEFMPGTGSFNTPMVRGKNATTRELPVMQLDNFVRRKGWFETKPNIEILKIDVEGHGAQVLLGARELVASGLVQNVFTETSLHKDKEMYDAEVQAVRMLVQKGYKLAGIGEGKGPGEKNPWPNDDKVVEKIFDRLKSLSGTHPCLNLWWSLNHEE